MKKNSFWNIVLVVIITLLIGLQIYNHIQASKQKRQTLEFIGNVRSELDSIKTITQEVIQYREESINKRQAIIDSLFDKVSDPKKKSISYEEALKIIRDVIDG